MEQIIEVGEWLADAFTMLWSAIGTWGIFGIGIIAPVVLKRVVYLFKKIFNF